MRLRRALELRDSELPYLDLLHISIVPDEVVGFSGIAGVAFFGGISTIL